MAWATILRPRRRNNKKSRRKIRLEWADPPESGRFPRLDFRRFWRLYINFAISDLDGVHSDLFLRRPRYHSPGANVELRAMPRALYGAAHQSAIRERAASMRAMIAERKQPFRASSHNHACAADSQQQHLAVPEFALVAHRLAPAGERSGLELACAGIAALHANLVAIDQRSAHPAGNRQNHHSNRH